MDQTLQSHGYLKISSGKGENLFEFGAENKEDCILISMHTPLWLLDIDYGIPNPLWLLDIDYGIPKFLVDEEMKAFRRILIALGISIFIVTFVLIPTFAYRSFRPLTQIIDTMISGSNTGAIMKKQIKSMEKNVHLLQEYRALDESIQDIDRSIDDKNRIIQEQQSLLKYVMQYIDDNIQNSNLCVNTIIDKFDISGPTLQKIVKKAANTTFSGYVEAKRLSLAYMLLSSSNIGIQEIAERCGFSSSNSFYKVFKRKYTFSPSSVRDENAERKSAEK